MPSVPLAPGKIGLTPEIDFAIFPTPMSSETLSEEGLPPDRIQSSASLRSLAEKGEASGYPQF